MSRLICAINHLNREQLENSLSILSHDQQSKIHIYEYQNILLGEVGFASKSFECPDQQMLFDGKIYNSLEIRDELVSLGFVFETSSDQEVVLKSYRHWGADCVKRFDGVWAFVILDKEKEVLFVSRDRFGVKPLYYIEDQKRSVFASEIKALLPYQKNKVVNKNEVIRYLIYGVQEHKKETMFSGIYRFPSSCSMVFDIKKSEAKFIKYFDLEIKNKKTSEEEAKIKLKELLKNSVESRLKSDKMIGMALSGGVDSNIIVSIANAKNPTIETFSSIYKAADQINENENIERTVKRLKLKQHYVLPNNEELVELIRDIVYLQDEPFDTLAIYAQYKVFQKMKESGVKVSLEGQGADEIFAGYPTYRAVMMREGFFNPIFWKDYFANSRKYLFQDIKLCLISLSPMLFERLYFQKRAKKLFTKKQKYIKSEKKSFASFASLDKKLLNDICEYLPVLLRYSDRNSKSNLIEPRVPFLDHRIVDFALSLPSKLKYKNGFGKYILRKTYEDTVDREIVWNKEKKGFPVPQNEWCSSEEFLKMASGYIENSKLLKELDINANIDRNDPMFWKVVNVAIWEDVYRVEI